MDDLSELPPVDEKPPDIKLFMLPSCFIVIVIAVPVDVLLISIVAICKSPYFLLKGWKRLIEDLMVRAGPFTESLCIPFASLSIILWPIAVVGAVIAAILSSICLGLYAGVIVHQEESFRMGLAYVVSVVSLFDEYTNDLLYLREGSCLPRLKYRKDMIIPSNGLERRKSSDIERNGSHRTESSYNSKLVSEQSRTLRGALQQYKSMQVWDWLFNSCEINGRILLRDELIDLKDVEECISKGNCKKLGIKLPAWSILQCLLTSAKSDSSGLIISEDVELTKSNWPRGIEWFVGPVFIIIKEQIKGLQLDESEELSLRNLLVGSKNDKPEEWDDTGLSSCDNVRLAQLQAIIRRLQGIVASVSRIPTFRRRFRNLVKVLYLEAIQATASENHIGGIIQFRNSDGKSSIKRGDMV